METENTLTVTINANGAAFTENGDPSPELARLLRLAADRISFMGPENTADRPLLDDNGNTVGTVTWVGELDDPDEDDGCEGHESLAGHHMGETVYCDGTCR